MGDKAEKPQTALTVQQRAGVLATEAATRFRHLEPGQRSRLLMAAAILAACFSGMPRAQTGGHSMRDSIRTTRVRWRNN